MHPPPSPLKPKCVWQDVDVSQRNTVLNRNRRLLLWWSQQKKDVNDVNLQFDNSQSGHAPPPPWGHGPQGGAWPDWPPGSATVVVIIITVLFDHFSSNGLAVQRVKNLTPGGFFPWEGLQKININL